MKDMKKKIHKERMVMKEDEEFNPELEDYEEVLRKFSSKTTRT